MVLDEYGCARGPPAEQPGRLASVVTQAPVLRVLHGLLQHTHAPLPAGDGTVLACFRTPGMHASLILRGALADAGADNCHCICQKSSSFMAMRVENLSYFTNLQGVRARLQDALHREVKQRGGAADAV